MKKEDIENRIKKIIAHQLSVDASTLAGHQSLSSDLGAESLDIPDIIMALEEEFNIELPDDEIDGATTLGKIANRVSDKNPE
ncbi:acyl carrier protein [Pseudomonas viridiflava]|uniref:acyl carrier protein n=1 Tax=Pseudomonas syringae group TaxID=136849 RepID=UPI000F0693A9|nr:acyl carrier protein [Pseudomonas viridiflava]MEE4139937.1 acyl carrier protein [Pseudomonas viridiflava]